MRRIGKPIWLAVAFDGLLPTDEVLEVELLTICERFGWTREYVMAMDSLEFRQMLTRLEALDSARAHVRQREQRRARG